MNQLLRPKLSPARISVYEGISPALLATMSLSQNIKGESHQELIESLRKSNVIQSQALLRAFLAVDRKLFTEESIENVYQNKPSRISKKQTMTDVFTHAVTLNTLEPYFSQMLKSTQRPLRILDIGTGHGYLSFVLTKYFQFRSQQAIQRTQFPPRITGIDCFEQCIKKCQQIQRRLLLNKDDLDCASLEFKQKNVKDLGSSERFDAIIGGFFIEPKLSHRLQGLLTDSGVGVWPSVSDSGQALYKFEKGRERQYLLETLFSQQVVSSSVDKYFISEEESTEDEENHRIDDQSAAQSSQQQIKEEKRKSEEMKNGLKKELQEQLKKLIEEQKSARGVSRLSLSEMQQNSRISKVLQMLSKFK